ncbi:hypothetical protein [Actinomadura madurae]|uniref:hypothetical protein n=1 Tax=Actinomadura madurae TaxID=1993 RepID=UPI0026E52014|nr:hypothetical protein [Actinomadura madurae]MCQ0008419.1 hypothetical protein [Actinomadura madurae]
MGKRNPESYPIRDGMEFGAYTFGDQDFGQIKEQLKKLRPEAVGDASTAYKDASDVLAEMTGELRNNFAKRIVQHWQGDVAQEALDQLGQVYETSGKLSDDSHNNAQLYNWYKTNILDWYKTTGESMEDGYVHTGGDDDRARELIEKFSRRMKEAFDGHPLKITKDLPTTLGDGHDKPPGGPGPGGGPGGLPGGGPGGFSGSGSGLPTSDPAGAFKPGGGPSPFAPGAAARSTRAATAVRTCPAAAPEPAAPASAARAPTCRASRAAVRPAVAPASAAVAAASAPTPAASAARARAAVPRAAPAAPSAAAVPGWARPDAAPRRACAAWAACRWRPARARAARTRSASATPG